jgi:hypothetical protein
MYLAEMVVIQNIVFYLSKLKSGGRDTNMVILVVRLIISSYYLLPLDRIRIYTNKYINMFRYKSHSYQNRAKNSKIEFEKSMF